LGIWEPFSVKAQTFKTAIEAAGMLLRVDDVVSGKKTKKAPPIEVAPEFDKRVIFTSAALICSDLHFVLSF
jgi:hypothetical protein